jgi:hypothetical protein
MKNNISDYKIERILRWNVKRIFGFFLAVVLIFSGESCTPKISFLSSSIVPAAQGYVKITKDKNKNYAIDIQLLHLAPPERLQPAKKVYVIWMITDQERKKNIGQINSSTSFLSQKLKASFKTVSSFKPAKIFITAEDDAAIQTPAGPVVLTTDNL